LCVVCCVLCVVCCVLCVVCCVLCVPTMAARGSTNPCSLFTAGAACYGTVVLQLCYKSVTRLLL
jgi:hypothetical protein